MSVFDWTMLCVRVSCLLVRVPVESCLLTCFLHHFGRVGAVLGWDACTTCDVLFVCVTTTTAVTKAYPPTSMDPLC